MLSLSFRERRLYRADPPLARQARESGFLFSMRVCESTHCEFLLGRHGTGVLQFSPEMATGDCLRPAMLSPAASFGNQPPLKDNAIPGPKIENILDNLKDPASRARVYDSGLMRELTPGIIRQISIQQ